MIGQIIGAVAGFGVNSLIATAVKTITPSTASKLVKTTAMIGAWAMSGLIEKGIEDTVGEEIASFQKKVDEKKRKIKSEKQPATEEET